MYRQAPSEPIACPRCKKPMPPTEVTSCACGTWLSAFAADIVLSAADRTVNRVTRWWRRREPCPVCEEQMLLCGVEPGLLQGCEVHGYFIDADTIEHTSIAGGIDHVAINTRRADEDAVAADAEKRLEVERARADQQRAKDQAEQRLMVELDADPDGAAANAAFAPSAQRPRDPATDHDQLARFQSAQQLVALVDSLDDDYPEIAGVLTLLGKRVADLESDRENLTATIEKLERQVAWLTEKVKRG